MATEMKDACSTVVEQAAITGVEATLSKSRHAETKSTLAMVERLQGNGKHALDHALDMVKKG